MHEFQNPNVKNFKYLKVKKIGALRAQRLFNIVGILDGGKIHGP